MSYHEMAADIVAFLDAQGIQKAVLVGHSVGGKVAKAVALLAPHRVDSLVVLDIAPVAYTTADAHWKAVVDILHTMKAVKVNNDTSSSSSRQKHHAPNNSKRQVEMLLQPQIPDPALRAFLLTNWDASRNDWKIPVPQICDALDQLADFDLDGRFEGDCFLIHGGQSRFVRHLYIDRIAQLFPNHLLTTIKGAGHWVHAEAPEDTTALLKRFLDR